MITKEHILSEIRRTTKKNKGASPGVRRFQLETGIKSSDWFGKYWVRWGDALKEAGFQPNQLQGRLNDAELLGSLATLAHALGHFPVNGEIRLAHSTDSSFPSANTFGRFGNKTSLASRLRDFCLEGGGKYTDVVEFCDVVINASSGSMLEDGDQLPIAGQAHHGYVYMVKHGARSEYKIGRTNNQLRREGELSIELPETIVPIHVIETDDPSGVESYWHRRFEQQSMNGEWFKLSADDVRAFKKWRRIC